jgi:hypothetical protein
VPSGPTNAAPTVLALRPVDGASHNDRVRAVAPAWIGSENCVALRLARQNRALAVFNWIELVLVETLRARRGNPTPVRSWPRWRSWSGASNPTTGAVAEISLASSKAAWTGGDHWLWCGAGMPPASTESAGDNSSDSPVRLAARWLESEAVRRG